MESIKDVKIDLMELEKEKQKNFEERLKFVDFLSNYIKSHPDKEWSRQQKIIIDSQIKE
jgi:hypothetical protein